MIKRCFVAAIGALLLLCLLCACQKPSEPPTPVPPSQDDSAILMDADGVRCRLVYPNGAGETVMGYVERICAGFEELTGFALPAYTEAEAPADDATVIWFGNTWAAWEKEIPGLYGYYEYGISVRDGDVYVYAMHEKVLARAMAQFQLRIADHLQNGTLKLDSDFCYSGTMPEYALLANIPFYDGGDYHSTHDCDNGYEMILIRNAEEQGFFTYCQKLESRGWSATAQNVMNGNLFRTYFNDKGVLLHTYWIKHSGEVRVIVADNPDYNSAAASTVKTVDTLMRPLAADGGMGYLFRLGDGRFLVVDGGYGTEECAVQLYDTLKELAPDPARIEIACWIFTHGHIDHVGAFQVFASKYAKDASVTVQSFMHNMCLTEEQAAYFPTRTWEKTLADMEAYYPNASVYIPLTGQTHHFANAELEILFTMPDFMPKRIENEADATEADPLMGDANIQSVVFRINLNGSSVLIMGDTTTVCCDEMSDRYGSYLKSDYVQMAHHGIEDDRPRARNATKEIYGLIDPSYALLPCLGEQVSYKMRLAVNRYLLELIGGERNLICSGTYSQNIVFP